MSRRLLFSLGRQGSRRGAHPGSGKSSHTLDGTSLIRGEDAGPMALLSWQAREFYSEFPEHLEQVGTGVGIWYERGSCRGDASRSSSVRTDGGRKGAKGPLMAGIGESTIARHPAQDHPARAGRLDDGRASSVALSRFRMGEAGSVVAELRQNPGAEDDAKVREDYGRSRRPGASQNCRRSNRK